MFSATVSSSKSEKCWKTMPRPSARAATGEAIATGLALPEDFSGARLDDAVEDLHQRRLAGAVFAEQRVDLARRDREVDAVVGEEIAVALGDSAQFDEGRCWGGRSHVTAGPVSRLRIVAPVVAACFRARCASAASCSCSREWIGILTCPPPTTEKRSSAIARRTSRFAICVPSVGRVAKSEPFCARIPMLKARRDLRPRRN